jgi:hypothetical protein
MMYFTSMPLFFSAPPPLGMGMDSKDTSLMLTAISGSKLFVQIFVFHSILTAAKSSVAAYRIGMIFYIPGHLMVPNLANVQRLLKLPAQVLTMCIFGTAESIAYLSVLLRVTESAGQSNLGLAHGFASTMAALVRAIAPSVTGAIWEWACNVKWPGLVFLFGAGVASLGIIVSFR